MRRLDTMWRDTALAEQHLLYGFKFPMAGIRFPMVEFDRGEPLALINYVRRDESLPHGPEEVGVFGALSALSRDGFEALPFLTCVYDPRTWAVRLFGHNDTARALTGESGWVPVTETRFVTLLYQLRGRPLPDLSTYGVVLKDQPWGDLDGTLPALAWHGADWSARRRAYEPWSQVPHEMRIPCADLDFGVVSKLSGRLSLLVDYKGSDTSIERQGSTHRAMSTLLDASGETVPAMVVRYSVSDDGWSFRVHCLNSAAERLLVLATNRDAGFWTGLQESEWLDLLFYVRGGR